MTDQTPTLRRGRTIRAVAGEVPDLASLQVGVRQGDSFLIAPVWASVTCGRATLRFGRRSLQLSARRIMIRAVLENAGIKSGSVRHIPVQEGLYRVASETGETAKTARDAKASDEIGVDSKFFSITKPWTWSNLKFGVGGGGSHSAEACAGEKVERKEEIWLVCGGGHNAVAIGDETLGDAHREDGILTGEYPRPDESDTPLFCVAPDDPLQPMRITLIAALPLRHLYLQSTGGETAAVDADVRKKAEKAAGELGRRAENAYVEALRDRFAAREIQSRARTRQCAAHGDLGLKDDEFAVTIECFDYIPSTLKDERVKWRRISGRHRRPKVGHLLPTSSCRSRPVDYLVNRPGWGLGRGSASVFESPAIVAGFDDFAMVGQAIQQC